MLHSQAYEIKSKQTLLKKMKYTNLAPLSYLAIRNIISISQEEIVQILPESNELELIREQGNTSLNLREQILAVGRSRSLLSTENLISIHRHSDETDRESGNGEEMELTRGGHAGLAASAPPLLGLGAEFTRQGPRGRDTVSVREGTSTSLLCRCRTRRGQPRNIPRRLTDRCAAICDAVSDQPAAFCTRCEAESQGELGQL